MLLLRGVIVSTAETKDDETSDRNRRAATGAWAPFGHAPFAMLWTATVVSNVGTWMNDVGAGWLMTELSSSPFVVAAVQAATTLPIFLFALLAGAVADIVDRRRILIVVNALLGVTATALAVVVYADMMTPRLLLAFTFLLGTGAAFLAPAWLAIVPSLVPKPELPAAIALNSMGINASRAIGPAVAGFLIVALGVWAPFALNAVSFVVVLAALLWWSPPPAPARRLPPEQIGGAILAGLRYTLNSAPLKATLVRAGAFFAFASAYWAMLPVIVRETLGGGPVLYGVLLTAVGAGAAAGALVLPLARRRFGVNGVVGVGSIGTALVLAAFAANPNPLVAVAASAVTGVCWIAVVSSLQFSTQVALPDWVRARGLSIFLTVFFGSMAGGSLIWGQVANLAGMSIALMIAAAGLLIFVPLTWRAKLGQGASLDLSPSRHWPEPEVVRADAGEQGPVMIQISYRVDPQNIDAFRAAAAPLAQARRRGGGYGWTLMQSVEEPDCFVETWYEASWTEHLRHHEHVTGEDRDIQDRVHELQRGGSPPRVRHFLSPGAPT
ncbi:MAG: MFS transporter [Alphaproteobacteria bacterium]|nr:MFS transporter [Alphaproteobacteria bacterium]